MHLSLYPFRPASGSSNATAKCQNLPANMQGIVKPGTLAWPGTTLSANGEFGQRFLALAGVFTPQPGSSFLPLMCEALVWRRGGGTSVVVVWEFTTLSSQSQFQGSQAPNRSLVNGADAEDQFARAYHWRMKNAVTEYDFFFGGGEVSQPTASSRGRTHRRKLSRL
jgi:hypothetical protein